MRKIANAELGRITVDEFKETNKNPFVIVLDNVRSLNNVGSAFRTGDAFLVEKIYLCGITGTPPHRDIQKTALGATESVAWEYFETTFALIQKLKAEGWQIVVIEQVDESLTLPKFRPDKTQKYAFVFGNEVSGVEDEIVKQANVCVEIPQFGTKHSLNIAVSIGVVIWDYISKTVIHE
ncbi:MAG: RNA methyltransferase [Microscillaceae bacterium]|jgi:tRNA G18 (ribose-2'-O)-methylase SpoU|nr:RNA methyltransferase [Microscillaceae bacterium]